MSVWWHLPTLVNKPPFICYDQSIAKSKCGYFLFFQGKSLVPVFNNQEREGHEALFWKHQGNRAVRQRKWKLVAEHGQDWELYDVENERSESHDVSGEFPGQVTHLTRLYEEWAEKTGVVPWNQLRK